MRDYKETLTFLYDQLPVYQKVGASAIKKDLTNITALTHALGNPHHAYPTIHIAGTNGKGTTAHIIAAILQASGLKVGLYTSPHYEDFRERIKVNGTYISESDVVSFVEDHQGLMETQKPSFFEVTVAMAFDHFKKADIDIAVIETGLGGRLDSTNIITPLLSVITNISLDHQNMLGPDIYTIAGEKAGIIKKETPIVIGRYQPSCDHVFINKAATEKAVLSFASLEWSYEQLENEVIFINNSQDVNLKINHNGGGPFLLENITTALQATMLYNSITEQPIGASAIKLGIEEFRKISNYKGRWQQLDSHPDVITDSAHNEDAISKVLDHINNQGYEQIHFVLGFVGDKDVDKILKMLSSNHSYYFTQPSIFRALDKSTLKEKANQHGLSGTVYDDVPSAYTAARAMANANDLVYIGGSSFVVADLLTHINKA